MQPIKPPESNELFLEIYQALVSNPSADGIHLSIEPHAREMKKIDGTDSFMKAVCWNLTVGQDDLSDEEPVLTLVKEENNDETLHAEAAKYFPGYTVLVDNDILVEEDPT